MFSVLRKALWAVVTLIAFTLLPVQAQNCNLNRLIVVNGGVFQFTPPYTNYVQVAVSHRNNLYFTVQDSIFDQSVSDAAADADFAFIATNSTVTKYDIADPLQPVRRTAQFAGIPGLRKLQLLPGQSGIAVSRGYGTPANGPALLFFDAGLVAITADTAYKIYSEGMVAVGDTLYVAAPGSYLDTTGSLAAFSLSTKKLLFVRNLGTGAAGIHKLYTSNRFPGKIICANTGPYGANGTLTNYDIASGNFTHTYLTTPLEDGIALEGDIVFYRFGGSIAGYNLATQSPVGTSGNLAGGFAAAAPDQTGSSPSFWVSTASYSAPGRLLKQLQDGTVLAQAPVGISPEVILANSSNCISSISSPVTDRSEVTLSPNPAAEVLNLNVPEEGSFEYQIHDILGKAVEHGFTKGRINRIYLQNMPAGVYNLSVNTNKRLINVKFVKL